MTRLSIGEQQGLEWVKAVASLPGLNCVELAKHPEGVAVRHSRNPDEGSILYTDAEFAVFLEAAKRGEFDHLLGVPAPRSAPTDS